MQSRAFSTAPDVDIKGGREVEMLSSKKLEMLNPFIVFELAVETY